jgi:membrane protease subunit HflC
MRILVGVVILIIAAAILLPQFLFTVDETQYVVVTRFGEVQRIETEPGLKTKAPFIDTATVLDKRLLRVDVPPSSFPDIENQFLEIDAYVRYRIVDPRLFRERLGTTVEASSRISQTVIAELRAAIGQRARFQIIGGNISVNDQGLTVVTPLLTDDGIPVREDITRQVTAGADARVKGQGFGIEIVEVRIKRADFPAATEENIFARMRTERDVQAQRLRAEGEEEFLTRTANVDRQVAIIGAEAEERALTLRGEGEGEAINILAEALEQDPELFEFLRTLEAYKAFLSENSTVVLNADSDLFKFLQGSTPVVNAVPTPTPAP